MKLKLYHQSGGTLEPRFAEAVTSVAGVPVFKWQTCLRSLVLVPGDFPHEEIAQGEWLEDESAYRRLLEITCGLHSPLVGETEVFGQFKDAVQARVESSLEGRGGAFETAFVGTLQAWSRALIEDVKMIRQKHLLDLGSQSYGSLVRREVREISPGGAAPHIEFLGAGQLACEILPWLMKALTVKPPLKGAGELADGSAGGNMIPFVSVHSRNVAKARDRLAAASTVPTAPILFLSLSEGPAELPSRTTRVLIVAAPMKAQDISMWVQDRVHYDLIIDLRGESRHDSLSAYGLGTRLRSLEEIFSSIEASREIALVKKNAALGLIDQRVEVRGSAATHRPFGWDDVC